MNVVVGLRVAVVCMIGLVIGACASSVPAPIADRKPGVPSPALPPSAVAKPATPPVVAPPVAQVPAEPQVEVKPIAAPPTIEARPIEVRPLEARPIIVPVPAPIPEGTPPVGAPPVALTPQKPSAPSLRAELKTEPRAFKAPYSDENLAALQRGDEPRRDAAKPEARVPDVKPAAPPVAAVKPEAAPLASAPEGDTVEWIWPAPGRVLDNFETNTKGVSISGRLGEAVLAAAGGRVVYSGSGLKGYGQLVIIKHNETFLSAYAHNSRILVKEGDAVKRGQKIAEIGATDTDRPKLHFEIRQSGKPVDPTAYLPTRR